MITATQLERAPMPKYDISKFADSVYTPDEDTFLLLDSVYTWLVQTEKLGAQKPKKFKILEVGSGSGVIITMLYQLFPEETITAVDINVDAVAATNQTLTLNDFPQVCMQSDLFSALMCTENNSKTKDNTQTNQTFDLIVFNPPYCPGRAESIGPADIALSGGDGGREVIYRFLGDLPAFLDNNGTTFMVVIHQNDPERIINEINHTDSLHAQLFSKKSLQSEVLYVIMIKRTK